MVDFRGVRVTELMDRPEANQVEELSFTTNAVASADTCNGNGPAQRLAASLNHLSDACARIRS